MQIIIEADALFRHLKKFEAIKQRYSQQSECINITTGENTVTLSATDGLISLSSLLPCYVEIPGTTTVSCKKLSNLLDVLPVKEVELYVSEDGLVVKTFTGEYLLYTIKLEAQPETTFTTETELNIDGKVLLDGISSTIFSASTEETKLSLCGVNLQTKETLNRFCATNGHHLSTYKVTGEVSNPESDFLITNKACRLLTKFLSSQDKVNIALGKESYTQPKTKEIITYEVVIFQFGNTTLKHSLVNVGMFPKYDQLIPRQFERTVLVERLSLIAGLENIATIAEQKNNLVKLNTSRENQEIILSCECDDVGTSKVSLPAQISGDSINCAFNLSYLLGGLKAFSGTEIKFLLNTALNPVVIKSLSVQKRKFLIMPIEVKW